MCINAGVFSLKLDWEFPGESSRPNLPDSARVSAEIWCAGAKSVLSRTMGGPILLRRPLIQEVKNINSYMSPPAMR